MTYDEMREAAGNGDLLLVEGRGIGGVLIRVFTGQQVNHVALLVWLDGGLWVAEMLGRQGFSLSPASDWVKARLARKSKVYFGRAPGDIRGCDEIPHMVVSYRESRPGYSWWTLASVWLAQLARRRMPEGLVCSTFVARVWRACGMPFLQSPDPGDYFPLCDYVMPVRDDA